MAILGQRCLRRRTGLLRSMLFPKCILTHFYSLNHQDETSNASAHNSDTKGSIAVAMSGGIDSSVVAMLLHDQGYKCVGVFMKNWDASEESLGDVCPNSRDREDMIQVCNRLGIPHIEAEFIKEYWTGVFEPFIEVYSSGYQTPNPDVHCNRVIKFDALKRYISQKLGIKTIATGHYAKLENHERNTGLPLPKPKLLCSRDIKKDQTHFLCMTPGENFCDVLFPLGDYTKDEVYALAAERFKGLNVLKKKESMGVCFIGRRNFPSFLSNYITLTPGRLIDIETGEVIGKHTGKETLTIGQGSRTSGCAKRMYVVRKSAHPRNGDVFVCAGTDHPSLFADSLYVLLKELSWVSGAPPLELILTLRLSPSTSSDVAENANSHSNSSGSSSGIGSSGRRPTKRAATSTDDTADITVPLKVRAHCSSSSQNISDATIALVRAKDVTASIDKYLRARFDPNDVFVKVTFAAAKRAISPGQTVGIYDGDVCLGGGPIAFAGPSLYDVARVGQSPMR